MFGIRSRKKRLEISELKSELSECLDILDSKSPESSSLSPKKAIFDVYGALCWSLGRLSQCGIDNILTENVKNNIVHILKYVLGGNSNRCSISAILERYKDDRRC